MKTKSLFALAILASGLAVPSALAADKTWVGGFSSGNWAVGTNWGVGAVAGDSLFFAGSNTTNNNGFTANTAFNGLTFNAGASSFTLAGNAINLAGNITNSSSVNQTVNLALALQQNIVVNSGTTGNSTAGGTTLGGIISGGFGLEKTGSGRLVLGAASTFSGGVRVSEGTLSLVGQTTAMGSGTLTLGSATGSEDVLFTNAGDRAYANNIVIAAGSGTRTIRSQTGGLSLSGSISLSDDLVLDTAAAANSLTLSTGTITGGNNIIVRDSGGGTGVVNMSGSTIYRSSFTGSILVENGARLNGGNAGGIMDVSGADVDIANGGQFTFNEGATVGGLNGVAGAVTDANGTTTRALTLAGAGTYSYAGSLTNTGSGALSLTARMNYGAERGVQTFSGNSTLKGGTEIAAGKLILDYRTDNTSKLNDTQALTFRGGTLELTGGNHTEAVGSATIAGAGQVNITRTAGLATLSLGALSWSSVGAFGNSGVINFSESSIATTTSANTRGILGDRARFTVGGANWALNDGSNNIVALASYDTFVGSGADAAKNYSLAGSGTVTANQNFNTLKIATTGSGQSLALGNQTLGFSNNGLLFSGTNDYSITTSGGSGSISGSLILHNYGSGNLTLGRMSGETFEHAGTGKTILTTASTSGIANDKTGLYLDSGTVQFSNNNQIMGQGGLRLNSGLLVADTTGGNISLTNSSVGGHRNISLGSDVPVIDVIGGGTLTIGGVISTNNSLLTISPIVFGSATSNGTIAVTGTNTYIGDTRLDGGRLSVNSASSLGSTSAAYKLIFSGNSTLNTTANIATSRYYDINTGVTGTIETDASTTLTHNGTIAGAGNLRKTGAGTLTINGTSTYTGSTTISAGTLILSGSGSINSSAVTVSGGAFRNNSSTNYTGALTFTSGSVGGTNLNGSLGGLTIGAGQVLSPGNSPGTAATTSQTWAGGGSYLFEVNNATGTAGADPGWDLLTGTDTLALTATSGSKFNILLTSLTIGNIGGDAVNFDGALGYSWKLADFANAVTGFDASAFNVNRSAFTNVATGAFSVALGNTVGGDNTQLYLVYTAVPEPATWLLLGLGLATVLVFRRRCR